MANTTSGTTTFDKTFAIDEIIEEAYDRLGMFTLCFKSGPTEVYTIGK
jgi:hypothetical protein